MITSSDLATSTIFIVTMMMAFTLFQYAISFILNRALEQRMNEVERRLASQIALVQTQIDRSMNPSDKLLYGLQERLSSKSQSSV